MRDFLCMLMAIFFTLNSIGQETLLIPSDGNTSDKYGYSVAYYESYAAIGSQNKDAGGINRGAVYLYKKNGDSWEEQSILTAPDAMDNDHFGHSVAMDGDYLIIGAHSTDDAGLNSGAAYIFHKEGEEWIFQTKITPEDAEPAQTFGISVDIQGDYAVIGANHTSVNGIVDVGAAYIFQKDGDAWVQQAKLTPEDGSQNDFFGQSVAIDGTNVIISSHFNNSCGNNTGSAYFFRRTGETWVSGTKIMACDAENYDSFGSSVDISGDYAVIGAFTDDDMGNASGSAYIFHQMDNKWTQADKLTASDGSPNDKFGYSVAIDGNTIAVGAYKKDNGAIYVFTKDDDEWTETQIIQSANLSDDAELGKSVSLSNGMVLTGAPKDDNIADDSGAALVFPTETTDENVNDDDINDDEVLGVQSIKKENFINTYPNPATNYVILDFDKTEIVRSVEIFDRKGGCVLYFSKEQPSYDVSNLPNGIYFVKIRTDKGLYSDKFVKHFK